MYKFSLPWYETVFSYLSPDSSITTDSDADNKSKSKLFVENIKNILSAQHSKSRFGGIANATFNQMPIS